MPIFLLLIIIFFASFTQSLAGFGSALVAMSLLPSLLGIQTAAPLVALLGLVLEIFLLAYFRDAVKISNIWRVVVASLIGVPIGIIFLKRVDERLTMLLLGVVITGYALYALLRLRLPRLEHSLWGYLAGFLAGMLGGAYNTSGPPVIIYGNCRGWSPPEFKGNLQTFFLVNSLLVAFGHFFSGSYNAEVWRLFLLALPAGGIGLASGLVLDRFINPGLFRIIVLLLLLVLGIRLIFFY
jgi:uncharacterized membrane protein YfcA